jgi:DNA mismatch repair protein MutL
MDLSPGRVVRLPEDLVNKIAAGEVVERPASVVKELLENALDAGAGVVAVDVEGGGKTLIRVRDDGAGIARDDVAAALERHATSKLRELADLQNVATHGFRGEALPAIASVSHLVLRTRTESEAAGTEAEVQNGRILHVRDAGHPRGTTLEVRDLFGGVPARRKFLRADATETSHVAEAVTLLAVARPETGFTLRSGPRTLVQAPPVSGLAERLYQLFGGQMLAQLAPVQAEEGWVRVRGFVARPDRAASARSNIRLYVNGRAVRDRGVSRAVAEAYRGAGLRDPGGEAFLFLEAPLHLVDVNVHPAKTEVRFAEARVVWAAVERAVRHALGGVRGGTAVYVPRVEAALEASFARAERVAEENARFSSGSPASPESLDPTPAPALVRTPSLLDQAPPTVLGQHRNTYIVATDGEELVLVDQHTAHERVRFERLVEGLAQRRAESQRLLVPALLDLPPRLRPILDAHRDTLAELGFEADAFGGDAIRLTAVPAVLGAREAGRALQDILRDLLERDDADWAVAGGRHRAAATLACHSAVRAGEPLSLQAMKAIVDGLGQALEPMLCPHGRPTRVYLPQDDLSRWFGRGGWRRK